MVRGRERRDRDKGIVILGGGFFFPVANPERLHVCGKLQEGDGGLDSSRRTCVYYDMIHILGEFAPPILQFINKAVLLSCSAHLSIRPSKGTISLPSA